MACRTRGGHAPPGHPGRDVARPSTAAVPVDTDSNHAHMNFLAPPARCFGARVQAEYPRALLRNSHLRAYCVRAGARANNSIYGPNDESTHKGGNAAVPLCWPGPGSTPAPYGRPFAPWDMRGICISRFWVEKGARKHRENMSYQKTCRTRKAFRRAAPQMEDT